MELKATNITRTWTEVEGNGRTLHVVRQGNQWGVFDDDEALAWFEFHGPAVQHATMLIECELV